jgi:hypothetical protein
MRYALALLFFLSAPCCAAMTPVLRAEITDYWIDASPIGVQRILMTFDCTEARRRKLSPDPCGPVDWLAEDVRNQTIRVRFDGIEAARTDSPLGQQFQRLQSTGGSISIKQVSLVLPIEVLAGLRSGSIAFPSVACDDELTAEIVTGRAKARLSPIARTIVLTQQEVSDGRVRLQVHGNCAQSSKLGVGFRYSIDSGLKSMAKALLLHLLPEHDTDSSKTLVELGVPVKELSVGSQLDRVRSVRKWIKSTIRTSMPVGASIASGFQSPLVHEVIRQRNADCKGFTVLAHAVLAAVGVKSEPVLVGEREGSKSDLTPTSFTHMVLWVDSIGEYVDFSLSGTVNERIINFSDRSGSVSLIHLSSSEAFQANILDGVLKNITPHN